MKIGLILGILVFVLSLAVGLLVNQSFPYQVFLSAIGFIIFLLVGIILELIWKRLALIPEKQSTPQNTVDFTVQAEVPDFSVNKGENQV